MTISFTPARSILGHDVELDHCAQFPVLGVPLELRSNSAAVLAAAERSFGGWRDLDPALIAALPPRGISMVVHPGDPADDPRAPFVQRLHSACFVATNGSNLMSAHLEHGTALGFVTPELVANDLYFRYHVLECLGLLLTSWHDRVPFHASTVLRGGSAIVLLGDELVGKSTLCYACLRAGFQLLAEDMVYVSSQAELRLWGNPWRLYLPPDACRSFPELADIQPQIQANGKLQLSIEVSTTGGGGRCTHAGRVLLCLVERQPGMASTLEPLHPQTLIAQLSETRDPRWNLYADATAVAARLAQGGCYRLRVGSDVTGAVALLKSLTG